MTPSPILCPRHLLICSAITKREETRLRIHFTSQLQRAIVSMEWPLRRKLSVALFLLLLFVAFFPTMVWADNLLKDEEMHSMIKTLRISGYHLFANALLTADILSSLSSAGSSYTFFAPPDAALYDLDLASKSSQEYLDAIKYHIVTTKLSYYNLNGLPNAERLDTLLQNRSLTLTTFGPGGNDNAPVMVNSATVSFPNLYYDYHVAAHGVATVLKATVLDVSLSSRFSMDAPIASSREIVRDPHSESNLMAILCYPLQTRPVSLKEVEEIFKEATAPNHESSTERVVPASCVGGRLKSAEYSRQLSHAHHLHKHHLRHHHGKHSHAHSGRHSQDSVHVKKSSFDALDSDSASKHAAASSALSLP